MTRMKKEQRRIMGNLCMKNDGTFGAIDDLTITYDGNRLLKVTDDAEALNYNGNHGVGSSDHFSWLIF